VADVDPLARRQILAAVEQVLVSSGVAGTFPTPLEPLHEAAGIREIIDMSDLPNDLVAKKPKKWRRILGALVYREETVFVDRDQSPERVLFTEAHETAHKIIPWHEESFYLDDEGRLFRAAKEQLELEANLGAALIIFQGRRFHEKALDYRRTIKTPILLASDVGASYHATIRHYVEYHPDSVALAVGGRYRQWNGHVPIWTAAESPKFRREFGPLRDQLPAAGLPLGGDGALGSLVAEALSGAVDPPSREIGVTSLKGDRRPFIAEAFYNQHCMFVMFAPRARIRTGRRVAVATR
jgi:IrrE N-terminal-like domain